MSKYIFIVSRLVLITQFSRLEVECVDDDDALRHKTRLEDMGFDIISVYPESAEVKARPETFGVGSGTTDDVKSLSIVSKEGIVELEIPLGRWTLEELYREIGDVSRVYEEQNEAAYRDYRVPQSFRSQGDPHVSTNAWFLIRKLFEDHWSCFDGLVFRISESESYRLDRIYKNTAQPSAQLTRLNPDETK